MSQSPSFPGSPVWLATLGVLGALAASPAVMAQTPGAGAAPRTVVTRDDQLPRRSYAITRLPSELLEGPVADVLPLAAALDRDIAADLAAFDIRDAATQRDLLNARLSVALLSGDAAAVSQFAAQVRALQDKPGPRLMSGVLPELALQAARESPYATARATRLQALVAQRFGAMPWADVQDTLKQTRGQFELVTPTLVVGSVRNTLDPAARNAGMQLDARALAMVVGARAQMETLLPLRAAIVAGMGSVIDRQAAAAPAKVDRWTPRLVTLAVDAAAKPVRVGIWDSGVDLALFKPSPGRGLGFDAEGQPTPALLRPLGEAQARWPTLRGQVKGAMDLRAALDTDEARRLKTAVGALKPEQIQGFQEDLGLASLYTHGTHVAGIAVAGNPFVEVFTVTELWVHRLVPQRPSEARTQRTVQKFARIVAALKTEGVRVVNMSWRYGPSAYEQALTYHGMGTDGEDRKRQAAALFAIERDALRAAIASAPEILFVAGSGNEDNSADFAEYIPAGLELPNLITAGAVDQAGDEASFSTFGKTVVVHANGFEVDSLIPGGDRIKFSGTSMAAPQVSNLAAKLFALKPELTAQQAKALILAHAERRGRVNLIDPRATVAALQSGPAAK